MKTKKRSIYVAAVSVWLLIGCGGGGENWGIDHQGGIEVGHGPLDPATGLYRCTINDATEVPTGATVTPLSSDTQVRVWHFQNSQEYVCTLRGQAIVES